MNKILFVIPPHITYNRFMHPAYNDRTVVKRSGSYGSVTTDMPLGVLSLSGYLKKHVNDIEVKLIDFNIILNELVDFEYSSFMEFFQDTFLKRGYANLELDIIAISSLFTPSYQSMLDIAVVCRILHPQALIVAGGGVPTNMYREIFSNDSSIDALCYGEGEKPLLSLVLAKHKKQYLENSPSWITRSKVVRMQTFQHEFIEDLDEIPYDYDICETSKYGINPSITAYASIDEKKQNFHVMTSRGCPHQCCFCSSHTVHGKKMRFYSLDRVREDFKRLKEEYGAKTLVFQDDHLMADKNRVFQILDIIQELQLKVVFQNALAMYALDRKMLEALKSAGVDQLSLSAESGSNRVLREIMHKPLDLSIVKRVSDDCRELGIYTNVAIMIGLPGETKNDIEISRKFFKTVLANWYLIFCASPLVGSEMYEICRKKNYLKGDFIGSDYKKAVVETEDFSTEYIEEMVYLMNLELNFIENSDYRLGNYEIALKGFEHVIEIKKDHTFAYYCAAKCHEKLGHPEKALQLMNEAQIAAKQPFWRKHVERFKLPLL